MKTARINDQLMKQVEPETLKAIGTKVYNVNGVEYEFRGENLRDPLRFIVSDGADIIPASEIYIPTTPAEVLAPYGIQCTEDNWEAMVEAIGCDIVDGFSFLEFSEENTVLAMNDDRNRGCGFFKSRLLLSRHMILKTITVPEAFALLHLPYEDKPKIKQVRYVDMMDEYIWCRMNETFCPERTCWIAGSYSGDTIQATKHRDPESPDAVWDTVEVTK